MRVAHWLEPNKGNEVPVEMVFVDTETKSRHEVLTTEVAELWFGWLAHQTRRSSGKWSTPTWHRFTSKPQFWRILTGFLRKKIRIFVYAHNWAFDLTVLDGIKILKSEGWTITKAVIDGPPVILQVRKDQSTLLFLDTLNYFRQPLSELGPAIGIDKKDYRTHIDDPKLADEYCKRDVEIIMAAMRGYIEFIVSENLGNYKETLAGQALNAFRHRFMTHPIFIDTSEKGLAVSRSAYYGGRTECNYIGRIKEPVTLVDVNSMYPFVMRENPYPTRLISVIKRCTIEELDKWLEYRSVCALVTIKCDVPVYPVRLEGRLCFPIGRFRTSLSTPELRAAISLGHIKAIHAVASYEQEPIFTAFVDYFYNKRLEFKRANNPVYTHMSKILQNSLYGKFGQSGRVWENITECDPNSIRVWTEIDAPTGTVKRFREFGGVRQEQKRGAESANSHPAIAAHVTAYARMYLWQLELAAGRKNVLYKDTDSLLVTQVGLDNLARFIDKDRLGALKVEKTITSGAIFTLKDYVWDGIEKIKGVKKSAIKLTDGNYWQPRFANFRGMIETGDLSSMRITMQLKQLTRLYKKGIVLPSGRVKPLVVNLK